MIFLTPKPKVQLGDFKDMFSPFEKSQNHKE